MTVGLPAAAVLAPLAARYAHWLGLPAAALVPSAGDEGPLTEWAMQLVLRVERSAPPARIAVLQAAASAAVAVCLDQRSSPSGEWHDAVATWIGGRIRKVARRARGAHWAAVLPLPGVTVASDGAEVRALLPGPVAELPREVARLQVAGTELPADPPASLPVPADRPVLWVNPLVPMTTGKAAAQVGHASVIVAALRYADGRIDELAEWASRQFAVAVRDASPARWRELSAFDDPLTAWRVRGLLAVRDAGYTEVAPGTVTVVAELPMQL